MTSEQKTPTWLMTLVALQTTAGITTEGWMQQRKGRESDKNKLGASKEGVIKGRKDGNDVSSKVF